ncbi:MAG: PqiC family protein [Pseudomonadota bacterium]
MNQISSHALLLALVCAVLTACTSTQVPQTRYFLFPIWEGSSGTRLPNSQEIRLTLEPLPLYLSQPGIVTQFADNSFRHARNARWAEPLQRQVERQLTQMLNDAAMTSDRYPTQPNAPSLARSVRVEIERFHFREAGYVELIGLSFIASERNADYAQPFRIERRIAADGYPAVVTAHTDALEALAEEIARQLTAAVSTVAD